MSTYYITTAIDYTNAPPHIGHAYEKVLSDVLARWHRLKGEDVFFLTGVDQHGQKVQQTAEKAGITPAEHAKSVTEKFIALWKRLGLSQNGWAETTDPRHVACVQKILSDLKDKGQLYKKSYKGFYSVRQEQFLTDKERNEEGEFGKEWGEVVELEEENWYFKLSDHAQWLKDFVEKSEQFITPSFRKAEVMNAIERSFGNDLCISRPKERLHWGIEFPFDKNFVTYVWFDALINYISFAGYKKTEGDSSLPDFQKLWPCQAHVIGKDIMVPAHAIYWPCMLHAMGFSDEEMPTLLVHGWWNINGEKMSKSLGNVVDPNALVDAFGQDAVRYYLVRDINMGKDSNFDTDRLVMLNNTELCNDFGNLCNRTINMTKRYCNSILLATDYEDDINAALRESMSTTEKNFAEAMDENKVNEALAILNNHVKACNVFIEQTKPFQLAKDETALPRLASILQHLLESCAHVAYLLSPILPEASARILSQLNLQDQMSSLKPQHLSWGIMTVGHIINEPSPVFSRILSDEEKEKLEAKKAKMAKKK